MPRGRSRLSFQADGGSTCTRWTTEETHAPSPQLLAETVPSAALWFAQGTRGDSFGAGLFREMRRAVLPDTGRHSQQPLCSHSHSRPLGVLLADRPPQSPLDTEDNLKPE